MSRMATEAGGDVNNGVRYVVPCLVGTGLHRGGRVRPAAIDSVGRGVAVTQKEAEWAQLKSVSPSMSWHPKQDSSPLGQGCSAKKNGVLFHKLETHSPTWVVTATKKGVSSSPDTHCLWDSLRRGGPRSGRLWCLRGPRYPGPCSALPAAPLSPAG